MIFWIICIQTVVLSATFGSPIENTSPPRVQIECVFPFLYQGVLHNDCIFEDGDDSGWCSRTNNYDQDRNQTQCWRPGDEIYLSNQTCVFPFIFKNTTYYNCYNLWKDPFTEYGHCGTTGNINIDRRLKYCEEFEDQLIESPEDSECVFPFQYKNETYEACSDIVSSSEHGQCATGSHDINVERTYRNCTANDVYLSSLIVEDFDVPCHFPFIFKNQSYDDCTSLVQHTKYGQCSTTSNFDKDGRYRNCTTVIGCHFPFVWKNQTHDDCIFNSFNDNWCSRTDNYDRDGLKILCYKYGFSERMIEEDDTHECHFPFTYRNRLVNRCINQFVPETRFICATTSNFNKDRKFKYCNQKEIDVSLEIRTTDNKVCKFPFAYQGILFYGCTTKYSEDFHGANQPWCVVEDPSGQLETGVCRGDYLKKPNRDLQLTGMDTYTGKKCVFPFEWKGEWFYGCTSYKHPDKRSYCATTERRVGDKVEYDDFDLCVVEANTVITTVGGNGQGANCYFPFKENVDGKGAVWSDKCINKGTSWGWWCSTTRDYTKDGKWGWCNVKNTDTKLLALEGGGLKKKIFQGNCRFPFIYGGKIHHACYGSPYKENFWCSTTSSYDEDESYKYCDKYDMWMTNQPKGKMEKSSRCTFPYVLNGKLHYDLMRNPWSNDNYGEKKFCSITRNFDRDRQAIYYVYYQQFTTTRDVFSS